MHVYALFLPNKFWKQAFISILTHYFTKISRKMRKILLLGAVCMLVSASVLQAQIRVSGKITGTDDGSALPGVNVIEQGSSNGTITDVEGNFSINVPEDATLSISYIGYTTQQIPVSGRTTIDVGLAPDLMKLEEVVVTALGVEKEVRKIGYSVEAVEGEELALSSEPNVLNALSGKVAGVQISQPNGVTGGTTRITIRGNNSLVQGKNQPLIIVDGVPIENSITGPGAGSLVSSDNGKDWGSGINNLNPWDIEEMNVLKGPTASALYGSRGANGVILIKTKSGKRNEGIGIEFNMGYTAEDPYRFRDVQNQFGEGSATLGTPEFEQDANGNNLLPSVGFWGSGVSWGPEMDGTPVLWWNGETLPFEPQPDNVKSFFDTGNQQNYNLAFSGANDLGSLRASITRTQSDAITPNTNREQNSVSLNGMINVTDRLKLTTNVQYSMSEAKNSPHLGNSESSIGKNLTYNWGRSYRPELERENYKNPDGTRAPAGVGYPRNDALGRGRGRTGSFFWNLYENNEIRQRDRLIASMGVSVDINRLFEVEGRLGIDSYNDDNESRNTPVDIEGLQGGRYVHRLARNRIQNHTVFLRLKEQEISSDLSVSAFVGGEYYNRKYYHIQGKNGNRNFVFPNLYSFRNVDFPDVINTNYATNQLLPAESRLEKEIQSVFGSVDFNFRDYLNLNITARNDWSSTLPEDNNSYFYPAASLGFIFTEAFGMEYNWLSFGKLRIAAARVANDTNPYETTITYDNGTFGGQPYTFVRSTIPPINLAPEQQDSYEIGLDLRFFNGRASLDFTYYDQRSFDQILQSPVPLSSGFSSLKFNTGELENKGVEIIVGGTPISKGDFSWDVHLNFAKNTNKLVSLTEGAERYELGSNLFGNFGPTVEARPGEDFGIITGWDYVYFDQNNNGETDPSERVPENRIIDDNGQWYEVTDSRVPLGNATPDFTGGITNTFHWKGFTVNTLIDAKIGGDTFWGSQATAVGFGQSVSSLRGRNAELGGLPWTDGEGVTHNNGLIKPGVYSDGTPNDQVVSHVYTHLDVFSWGPGIVTPFVSENSWVNLREVSISYNFPKALLEKTRVFQNLRLTVVGRNLAYLYDTAPENLNPEGMNGSGFNQGIEWGGLPASRSFGVVLNTQF